MPWVDEMIVIIRAIEEEEGERITLFNLTTVQPKEKWRQWRLFLKI